MDRNGRLDTRWREGFVPVRFVDVGMKVIAPYNAGCGVRCKVVVAAGYHARVENKSRGFVKWFHVDDLAVEKV